MRVICSVILSCISLWISSIEAARWSDWQELTKCNAKPCNCNVTESKRTKCEQGEIIKLRFCIHEEGDTQGCQWDKEGGAMKREKCMNNGKNCPGWSDWQLGKCDCESNFRLIKRECNNPPPIHNDVLCKNDAKEDAMKEEQTSPCNCTEEEMATTTTTTTTAPTTTTGSSTTPLPCCKEENKGNDNENNGNVVLGDSATEATTTTTKKPSQVDLDYYAMYDDLLQENPNCRNCSSAEKEADNDYVHYLYYDEDGGDQGDGGDGEDSYFGDL
ncbi:ectin-like [Ruditapes philippinarum]|uniref:ectin-like n=1 Tax=Ruditapes philippinarum TaxID=129788 RepID=UPI00295B2E96|nr:ectin-like [Ruditapes philippinarum]